jgi:hypothetical protein
MKIGKYEKCKPLVISDGVYKVEWQKVYKRCNFGKCSCIKGY